MHVHVPQARDQVFAIRVDDVSVYLVNQADICDSGDGAIFDNDSFVARYLLCMRINDVYIGEN